MVKLSGAGNTRSIPRGMSSVPTSNELWCLLDDDSAKPFTITLPDNVNINTLGVKRLIKAEGVGVQNARDLTLWKVRTVALTH